MSVLKKIFSNINLSDISSVINILKIFGSPTFGIEPQIPIPPPLLLVGANLRPGMSARNLSKNLISRLEQRGIPMGVDVFGGEDNLFAIAITEIAEEMLDEIRLNGKVDIVIPPGTIQVTAVGANAGGPILVQGANTIISSGNGIIT
jgi:hypothetical protein